LLILNFLVILDICARFEGCTVVRLDYIVSWHDSIQISLEVSLSLKLLAYWREFY